MFPELPIDLLLRLALQAANGILEIYKDEALMKQYTLKQDASPVTLADRASHEIIVKGLQAITPGIPVLSEEGAAIPYEERKQWEYFWCVDPLDGTKEFLQRNDEFTVNIALIHRQTPVLGIICLPVLQTLYYGSYNDGSWKRIRDKDPVRIYTDKRTTDWTAVGSRSHAGASEREMLNHYPVSRQLFAGSSLKFCLIAEGSAHLYYREGPTMEWDTAAGHAIVQYSGGALSMPSGGEFLYNKTSLINGPFICTAYKAT
ncbi:3'(2'),5'-bisphosphate nucleotidase CysQ [Niastella yeongjuensis]|uniref:3'(2'),5'-bisphosphate nucleotidase CysQ n=1 Tax=Niastella yeongjuensis TaxID=354355 RepID=UPI0008D0176C|nr:3'(2'),5'-bisphosphate nucleotidase CysQ [Niastella yeongjuensis]SEP46658.1 3'(2'),5'-bisphosphate nucleotidase [Niastella yeongjuensis]